MELAQLADKFGIGLALFLVVAFYLRKDILLPWRDRWLNKASDQLDKAAMVLDLLVNRLEKMEIVAGQVLKSIDLRLANLEESCEKTMKHLDIPLTEICGRGSQDSDAVFKPKTGPKPPPGTP